MAAYQQIIDREGLPAAVDTERTVLGAMLSDPVAVVEATDQLQALDFSLDSHQRIYAAMLELTKQGDAIDFITVRSVLERSKALEAVGGRSYLYSLTESIPRNLNVSKYVRILKEKATLRDLIRLCELGMDKAADQSEAADQVQAYLSRRLEDIALSTPDAAMEHVSTFTARQYPTTEKLFVVNEKSRGLPTYFSAFDELTGGLHPGELIILAARPSMGKTALVTSLLGNHVPARTRIAVFPLESGKDSTLKRIACGRARASLKDLRKGSSSERDKAYITDELSKINESGIFWSDTPNTTMSQIRARMMRKDRELKRDDPNDGLELGIVDQLTWVSHADMDRKEDQRLRFGHIAKGCKALAKELGIPIVLVCQLARPSTTTHDVREPRMSDLAESGYLEQHADVVMFAHRPEYYNKDDDSLKGKAFVIVDKNRDGNTGKIEMQFRGECVLWTDLSTPAIDFDRLRNEPPDYGNDVSAYTV